MKFENSVELGFFALSSKIMTISSDLILPKIRLLSSSILTCALFFKFFLG